MRLHWLNGAVPALVLLALTAGCAGSAAGSFGGLGAAPERSTSPVRAVLTAPAQGSSASSNAGLPNGGSGAQSGRATLAFVGDILLADRIGDLIRRDGAGAPWAGVADVLRQADLAAGNLETSVGRGGRPEAGKQYTFRAEPEALQGLVEAGVGVVGLGNNHVLDFGEEGLRQTLRELDEAGLAHTGAGLNQAEAYKPVLRDVRGVTVGFLSFSRVLPEGWAAGPKRPGVASAYDEASMLRLVRGTAARCDVLAVSVHWGEENKQQPPAAVQKVARKLVDAGADLVVGHHPHVWQGLSSYHGALIAYSLGNFVFTTSNPVGVQTGVLLVDVSRQGVVGGRIVPARIDWGRTVLATPEQAKAFLDRLRTLSDLPLDEDGAFRLSEHRPTLDASAASAASGDSPPRR